MTLCVPGDTRRYEKLFRTTTNNKNFYYIFNYPHISIEKSHGGIKIDSIKIDKDIEKYRFDENLMIAIKRRNQQLLKNLSLSKQYKYRKTLEGSLLWRMVIGLGSDHPQETSMTLHHLYGIPYIPGSAIKGVTRHWFLLKEYSKCGLKDWNTIKTLEKILETLNVNQSLDSQWEKYGNKNGKDAQKLYQYLKENRECVENYQNLFGTQSQKGKVVFLDAYPYNPNLKLDIMNPHYPDYYSGAHPPTDYQNPIPISFLTVEKTTFQFTLVSKEKGLLDIAICYLKEALEEYGIGAKTSVGYGLFEGLKILP